MKFILPIFFISVSFLGGVASAQEYSSTNFTVSNPVVQPGEFSTSTNFQLIGVFSQLSIGTSTADLFQLFGGFLYFPFVSTPAVTATPGANQVRLTWTSADASTGWAVGGYHVGQAATSGGPYTFTDVGNVLDSTRTSLTAGTPYYFVIRVHDALGNAIATSTEVSATPAAPSTPAGGGGGGSGGGGGGGGGGITYGSGSVNFSGRAYPRSVITILRDAQIVLTTVADVTANFQATINNVNAGNYFFSIYSEDDAGNRSSLVTFPVGVTTGGTTNITGIFIAPTIAVDKSQVRKGDNIAIFGKTSAQSEVTIQVNSEVPHFAKTSSDAAGAYLYNFDTSVLEYGDHSTKSKTAKGTEISSFSSAVPFVVGTTNIAVAQSVRPAVRGDANNDRRVNLVDFSIVAYWYKRPGPPRNVDINGDGKVDLVDFSIIAFNWTG